MLPAWLTRPFTRWDAAHLLRVARVGYVTDRDAAFFPLYPCLVHCVTKLLPFLAEAERYVVAGTLLSNACFVCAVVLAYDASLKVPPGPRGQDRPGAVRDAGERVLLGSVLRVAGRVPGLWWRRLIRKEPAVARFRTIRVGRCHSVQRVPPRGSGSRGRAFEIGAEARPVAPAPRHIDEIGICPIAARREGFVALS